MPLVSEIFMSRISDEDVVALVDLLDRKKPRAAARIHRLLEHNARFQYVFDVLRFGVNLLPERFNKTGLSPATPPNDILLLDRRRIFAGDLFFCDLIAELSEEVGLNLSRGDYLDFGCASGRIVRNMAAAFPGAAWHGCDPRRSAIEWAQANFPQIRFYANAQVPPLEYEGESMDGIFACSIWSHFSRRAGRAWLDEMERILKPGGWLLLTTSGEDLIDRDVPEEHRDRVKAELRQNGFAYYGKFDGKKFDLDTSDWGYAFITRDWMREELTSGWEELAYRKGCNNGQDVMLVRKPGGELARPAY